MTDKTFTMTDAQKKYLERLAASTLKSLETAPEGSLNIKHTQGRAQYFQYLNGKKLYLPKSDLPLIQALAQKDYDLSMLKLLNQMIKSIERFQERYPEKGIDSLYDNLSDERKALVRPVRLTDEDYIRAWSDTPYQGKSFSLEDSNLYYTGRGERVRSKSEVIIADTLSNAGLPYKYECPLNLGGITVYPDFTILDIRTRKVRYLEHFGMMDDEQYFYKFTRKLSTYETNGILQGRDLIMTFEAGGKGLDTRLLKSILNNYFGWSC